MQSPIFYKYVDDCFAQLQKGLEEFKDTGKGKFMLEARRSIKKIRISLECLEESGKGTDFKKERKALKKIFREGGEIRELLIYQDWFHRFHLMKIWNAFNLSSRLKKKVKNFSDDSPDMISICRDAKENILPACAGISQQEVFRIYVNWLSIGLPLLTGLPPKEEWHERRKQFKRVLYARHWQDEEGLRVMSQKQALFLESMQKWIGIWHDQEIMMEWLRKEQQSKEISGDPGLQQRISELLTIAYQILEESGKNAEEKVVRKFQQSMIVFYPLEIRLQKFSGLITSP